MEVDRRRNARRLVGTVRVLGLLSLAAILCYCFFDGSARIVAVVSVGFILVGLAFWKVPQWQAETAVRRGSAKEHFDLENEARKTLAQALGGVLLVTGLAATWLQLEQSRQQQRSR